MIHSESLKNIIPALIKAQSEMGKAVKGAENPFFHSDYADLSEVMQVVKEPLNNNGLVIMQPVDQEYVKTAVFHTSGEWISSEGTKIVSDKPNNPQAQGSAITYAKRYDLQALLFVPTVDDDGETAVERKPEVKIAPKPRPKEDGQDDLDFLSPVYRNENHVVNTPPDSELATLKQKEAITKIADQAGHPIAWEELGTWTKNQASTYISEHGKGSLYKIRQEQSA